MSSSSEESGKAEVRVLSYVFQCSAGYCTWEHFQCRVVESSGVPCGTLQYSTLQYSTVQYSTVQYSTVRYSAVQCSSKVPGIIS